MAEPSNDVAHVMAQHLPDGTVIIQLPCFGIILHLDRDPSEEQLACGKITTDLALDTTGDDDEYLAAVDGLESLILAHACAGVDVSTPAYIEGIRTAVEAIAHHYD